MISAACLALGIVASTIQWGWADLDEGGREYIVQVEPQLTDIDAFRKQGFFSDIPPGLRDIRRIRIVVGSDPVSHQGEIPPVDPAPARSPTASDVRPTAPETLPSDVPAEPLKSTRPSGPSADKVALTDGHQATEPTANENEPASEKAAAPAKQPSYRSPSDSASDGSAATTSAGPSATPPRPWLTLLVVAGGLIISLSGNVFLGWAHWGTRNQYRALVTQLRAQRHATAM